MYAGTADLYVYFYARAVDLLRANGQLSCITWNKHLRANYGKGLRGFLSSQLRMSAVIDFGDLPVFEAAAYPCTVLGAKDTPDTGSRLSVLAVEDVEQIEDLREWVLASDTTGQTELASEGWKFSSGSLSGVLETLKLTTRQLETYVGGVAHYGMKTGLGAAFVIDGLKRAELIAADPSSAEIIKPWLRGRDVKRWRVESQDLYVIFTRQGIDIDRYPAIKAHLEIIVSNLYRAASMAENPDHTSGTSCRTR